MSNLNTIMMKLEIVLVKYTELIYEETVKLTEFHRDWLLKESDIPN